MNTLIEKLQKVDDVGELGNLYILNSLQPVILDSTLIDDMPKPGIIFEPGEFMEIVNSNLLELSPQEKDVLKTYERLTTITIEAIKNAREAFIVGNAALTMFINLYSTSLNIEKCIYANKVYTKNEKKANEYNKKMRATIKALVEASPDLETTAIDITYFTRWIELITHIAMYVECYTGIKNIEYAILLPKWEDSSIMAEAILQIIQATKEIYKANATPKEYKVPLLQKEINCNADLEILNKPKLWPKDKQKKFFSTIEYFINEDRDVDINNFFIQFLFK